MQPVEGFLRVIKGEYFRSGDAKIKESGQTFFIPKLLSSTKSAVAGEPVFSGAAGCDLSSGR